MTHQHPLTDEICEELSSCITTLKSGDVDPYISPFDVKVDMQRAADWQLEQVVKALDQCKKEKRSCIEVIYLFHQKLEAMRPTTTQEDYEV